MLADFININYIYKICFESRNTPVCCIAILSILTFIGGVLMIVFTVIVTGMDVVDELSKTEGFDRFNDVKGLFFAILLVFSLITICLSTCGLICRCVTSRRWACVYGVLLLPSFIVLVVFGFIFVAMSAWGKEKIEQECLKLSEALSFDIDKEVAGKAIDIEINLQIYDAILLNTSKCTVDCPCADVSTKDQWLDLPEEALEQGWPTRTAGLNFSGNFTSYSECIEFVQNPIIEPDSNRSEAFYMFAK